MGGAKGKQSDTEALCQPPPLPSTRHEGAHGNAGWAHPPQPPLGQVRCAHDLVVVIDVSISASRCLTFADLSTEASLVSGRAVPVCASQGLSSVC